jgi:hypothetical protein
MSSAQHATEQKSIGRIAPLNMTSGTGRLSYDSLMEDLTTANDYSADVDCVRCHLWA